MVLKYHMFSSLINNSLVKSGDLKEWPKSSVNNTNDGVSRKFQKTLQILTQTTTDLLLVTLNVHVKSFDVEEAFI